MKRRMIPYGVVCLVALVAATAPAAAADTYTIGIIAPTTGPIAAIGSGQLEVAQLWRKQVNAAGGIKGRQIVFQTCNDEGNPEKAVACARQLISDGSLLLANFSVTGPIRATIPVVAHGPVMVTASPNVNPDPKSFVFQVTPTDRDMAEALAAYLEANGIKRIGMVAATDSSGEVSAINAQSVFPNAGIQLSLQRIDVRATDASIQLASLASSNVSLIYSAYSGAGAATVVKGFTELGLKQPLVVSVASTTDSFIRLIKDFRPPRLMGLGIKFMAPALIADPAVKQRATAFAAAFHDETGKSADALAMSSKLVMDTFDAVLSHVSDPRDAEAVKHYLETTPIESVSTLVFSPESHVGLGPHEAVILELKQGKWGKADPIHP